MTRYLVHGLGQTEQSWNKVIEELSKNNIEASNPNLFNLAKIIKSIMKIYIEYLQTIVILSKIR